jgi:hypothetical protein
VPRFSFLVARSLMGLGGERGQSGRGRVDARRGARPHHGLCGQGGLAGTQLSLTVGELDGVLDARGAGPN